MSRKFFKRLVERRLTEPELNLSDVSLPLSAMMLLASDYSFSNRLIDC